MSKNERIEKIKMWEDLAKEYFNLEPVEEANEKPKDIQWFISNLRNHLIESKINNRCYKFGDKEVYIEDIKIQLRVNKVNNKGFLGIHNTTPAMLTAMIAIIGLLITLIRNYENMGSDIKTFFSLILIVIQYIFIILIYMDYTKALRKNTDLNCYNELCLQVIENIENGVYNEILETETIIKKDNIIKRLSKKLNT